ncbi:hypothetical protein UFOVP1492_118 [uncultured Caudovirales phage]|uniref:Uncharacterized protein n=1 Tax=uncultured Caudovirales phage TaxID=2100421 RepID=A0A6J5SQX9_9CAUD|nr:hypothetical protein UFOVP1127_16 [uncultured Caudovirales phage]CAB4193313.1 hypothetical protein UFOVP1242_58 [uncultured Caudovirales phage]CAB4217888.1 hypothetical protein UFOVP1492_118 [uncultured Caudovirales phage]CAB5231015.1 hypothetical protein UFOVP1580_11 [uncultured Caudovirales phage]
MATFLKIGSTGAPTTESTVATSAGATDAGKVPGLDGGGKLDATFMPTGFGADTRTVTAGETLAAGDLIYLNGSGAAMKADANAPAKAAIGFVLSGIANAATGTAYFGSGIIAGQSGLTPGAPYFLSNTSTGDFALYASLTLVSGDIVQKVGAALSATELYFEPEAIIVIS